jgi:hypothetical protein
MGCPCNKSKQYGGAGLPLSYVNPRYQEPSASQGTDRLGSESLLARPVLNPTGGQRSIRRRSSRKNRTKKHTRRNRKGGFYPSVMGQLINNGAKLLPAAGVQAYRMVRNYKSRKNRK